MNKFFILIVCCLLYSRCNNDCIKQENRDANYIRFIEKDPSSNYYNLEIVRGFCTYRAEFDYCNSPRAGDICLNTISFKMQNLIDHAIDVKINLFGVGEKTYSLNSFEVIDIKPLPDYCKNRSWGEYIDVKYK